MNLSQYVAPEYMLQWLIMGVLAILVLYKYIPSIKKNMEEWHEKRSKSDKLYDRMTTNEDKIQVINSQIESLSEQLTESENKMLRYEKILQEELNRSEREAKELRIITNSLLAIMKGLEELGADGPVKEAHLNLEEFITKQAHRV